MSYYASPEELAANPPESWRVEKRGDRWALFIDGGDNPLFTSRTKREALEQRDNPDSVTRRKVEQERRWYEGETPAGWKSWAECLAGRQRNEAYQAKRRAERAA